MAEELTETEKMLAEIIALKTIRINHLIKAFDILENVYVCQRELNTEETDFIDEVKDSLKI